MLMAERCLLVFSSGSQIPPERTKRNGIPLRLVFLSAKYQELNTNHLLPDLNAVPRCSHARSRSPTPVTAFYDPLLTLGPRTNSRSDSDQKDPEILMALWIQNELESKTRALNAKAQP